MSKLDVNKLGVRKWYAAPAIAVSFLTILPTPTVDYQPGGLGQAARWFSTVGLLLGLLLGGAQWLFSGLFPPLLAATLTVALWAILTGGLHLDGLADCCDGLLAPTTRERRLEIMRDPRCGAFAVVGVVLVILLKTAAVAALRNALPALLFAPTLARWLLLWVAQATPARPGGMGTELRNQLAANSLLVGALPLLLVLFAFFSLQLLAATFVAALTVWLLVRAAQSRIGGVTGDVFGLTVELSEVVVLLCCAAGL